MNRFLLGCFLLFAALMQGQAQAVNPFELRFRLPKTEAGQVNGAADSGPVNPFDMVPHRTPSAAKAVGENQTAPFRPFSILPRGGGMQGSTVFWVLVAMFGFMTFSIAANRKVVGKAWRGFLSDSSLTPAQREAAGFVGSTPYYLMYANFVLQAGMFIFLVLRFFNHDGFNNAGFLAMCMVLSAFAFLTKHVLLYFTGWLFPVGNTIKRYNFLIIIFNCVLGLFLVPFNLFLAFGGEFQGFLVFWTLGLVTIFYVYRSLRAAPVAAKFLGDDQFHFLLYLCTVEIAPVLFLIKLVMVQAN